MATYYGHNNVKFTIDNQSILVDNVSFSLGDKISEDLQIDRKGGFDYVAENGAEGSLSLAYFLEGEGNADPLLTYINNDSFLAFDAAGLTQQKAYLTSYSITASPFGAAKVSATLSIYEDFGGSFVPATVSDEERVYLKFSDMLISFQGIDATANITSLNYNVNKIVEPCYLVDGAKTPSKLQLNQIQTDLSLESYGFTEALPYDGKAVSTTFSLGENEYHVNGIMQSKDIGFVFADKIKATLSIKSNSYGGVPDIQFIWRDDWPDGNGGNTALDANNSCYIYGNNLESVTAIYFNNNIKVNKFSVADKYNPDGSSAGWTDYIFAKIPRFAKAGPVVVVTANGKATERVPIINNSTYIP